MEITDELRVLVTAEVDKAVKNLKQLDKGTETSTDKFEELGKAIGSALLAKAVIDFGKESVKAAEDARQKFALLKNTIEITGAVAWTNADAMAGMAKELSDASNYSVSEIQSMQTVLLGFRNISGDTFREASDAIMDMATVMGMDLKSAVQTVGKALDDPVNGIDSLKRQGFAFTDSQKSMLKSMVAVGDTAGAQKVILSELATTYGGAAKAAQTSFAKLEHSMDDLKETAGNILTPMLADIARNAVELLEKSNSLDAGTQRMILTAGGLVAVMPGVGLAVKGVSAALATLAANPVILGITGVAVAVGLIAGEACKASHAGEDLRNELVKNKNAADRLLDSFGGLDGEKKLDEKSTADLIALYPSLATEIEEYATSVDEAREAVRKLTAQEMENSLQGSLNKLIKWQGQLADVNDLLENQKKNLADYRQLIKSGNSTDDERMQRDTIRMLGTAITESSAKIDRLNGKIASSVQNINSQLATVGKTLDENFNIVDLSVKINVEPKFDKNGGKASDIAKIWQEWLSQILQVDQSLFKTGEEAAAHYISGLERKLENAEGVSEILGRKFSAADIIDRQLSETESKIQKLLNIDPPLIDQVFSLDELKQEGTALNGLYKNWQELQGAKADWAIKDLQKQIDDLSKSEFELYLETNNLLNAPPEKIDEIREKLDELKLNSFDDLGEKLGFLTEKGLEQLDLFDEESRRVIGSIAEGLANVSFDATLTGFKEFGKALGEGKDAADSLQAALAAMAQEILNQLPMMFLQAGLQLIAQGQWPLGLGFIAAAGSSAVIAGYVDGKTSSSKEDAKANALGGVYGAGDYSAFAKGGTFTNTIVQSPTFFKFAKGSGFGTGLMGEAGPEAVMPLTRGADGSLGVNASGIGSGGDYSLTVIINNYGNDDVRAEETTDEETGSRRLEITVGAMINRHLSDGSADRALKSRYGLKVQGV